MYFTCYNCGEQFQVADDSEFAYCPSCGKEYDLHSMDLSEPDEVPSWQDDEGPEGSLENI